MSRVYQSNVLKTSTTVGSFEDRKEGLALQARCLGTWRNHPPNVKLLFQVSFFLLDDTRTLRRSPYLHRDFIPTPCFSDSGRRYDCQMVEDT